MADQKEIDTPNPVKTYVNRPGTSDSGRDYEIKIAALLLLRCISQKVTKHAWIAMNVDQCGAFDDLVLYKQTHSEKEAVYLIQLKHEEKGTNIKAEEFKSKKKRSFLLPKYFESISDMKKAIERRHLVELEQQGEGCRTPDEGEGVIDFILRNYHLIVFILFTNRGITTGCNFLKTVEKKSPADTQWMLYETINTSAKGIVCEFDVNKMDVAYDADEYITTNLYLLIRQEHVTKLDAAVLNCMKNYIQPVRLLKSDLSHLFSKFLQFLTDWSKGSLGGYYQLTERHVLKKFTELLLKPYMVSLGSCSGNYRQNGWNDLINNQDVIIINEAGLHVVEFIKDNISSVLEEYQESLRDWWKDNRNTIKQELLSASSAQNSFDDEIYEYLWKIRKVPLLLEVCDSQSAEELQNILKFSCGIFQVIVINQSDRAIERVSGLRVFSKCEDLDEMVRQAILRQPFMLQGRPSSGLLTDVLDDGHLKHISSKDVIYILCSKFNIGNKLEPLPEFFEETSLTRVWLDISILKEIQTDFFIVKSEAVNCQNYFGNMDLTFSTWPNFDYNLKPSIIICEDHSDLGQIKSFCLSQRKQFHVLVFHAGGSIEWVQTSGSIGTIKSYRVNSKASVRCLALSDLISDVINRKSVLISSNPGMGKSVFINYVAKNMPSNWWVLKINLAEHREIYGKWETANPSPDLFSNFIDRILLQQNCSNNLPGSVFRKLFNDRRVIFLMDGFDEIPINYQPGAKKLVQFIHDAGYLLCLTTRPVAKLELESILNTFSISLNLFTRSNQKNFLEKYFSSAALSSPDERVKSFVGQLLDTTARNFNDRDNFFVGVPLQTVLLAQVFVNDCIKYLQTGEFQNTHFDLLYLYKHFFREKLQIARAKVEGMSEDLIAQYKVCRSFYALRVIFSEKHLQPLQIDQKLELASHLFPLMMQLIQKDGVVVAEKDNDVTFVHRTFAEYLVAEWLSENLSGEYENTVKGLVVKIFQPNFEVVRNIFDRILAEGCRLHLAIINRRIDHIKEIVSADVGIYGETDKGNRTFLHLIASWGQHHPQKEPTTQDLVTLRRLASQDDMIKILKLIPSRELSRSTKDVILNGTPLDYAIISGSLNVANAICIGLKTPYYFETLKALNMRQTYMYKMNYNSLFSACTKLGFSYANLRRSISHDEGNYGHFHYAIEIGSMDDARPWLSKKKYINSVNGATGYTPLHIAVIHDQPEMVDLLLSYKADPNKSDSIGRTPLHWALSKIAEDNVEIKDSIVEMLLRDEYVDIADNDGNTALILAAYNGHAGAIGTILSRGPNLELKNKKGDTAMIASASNGHTDIVRSLLANGSNRETTNHYGYTALVAAALEGQTGVVDLLISEGSNKEAKGKSGNTALIVAACGGHSETFNLLVSRGCDVNARNNTDNTALLLATYNGHIDTVKELLLRGADIEARRADGYPALVVAAYNGLSDVIELLLSHGADLEAKNNSGNTALTIAAHYGHIDVVRLLLSRGIDKDAQGIDGRSALMEAARIGHVDTLSVLLSSGCNKELKDVDGRTPLVIAAENGHSDVVNLLLSEGALKEARTESDVTALVAAACHGHANVVDVLLSHGADIETTRTNDGATPLIMAARTGHHDVVNLLLSKGASLESSTRNGITALLAASNHGYTNIVATLLRRGANKEARTDEEATPFILAGRSGHTDVLNLLFAQDSDKEAKTKCGDTALMLAARNGHTDAVKLLLSLGCSKDVINVFGDTVETLAASDNVVKILCSDNNGSSSSRKTRREVDDDTLSIKSRLSAISNSARSCSIS